MLNGAWILQPRNLKFGDKIPVNVELGKSCLLCMMQNSYALILSEDILQYMLEQADAIPYCSMTSMPLFL